jgi:hypothetical protein
MARKKINKGGSTTTVPAVKKKITRRKKQVDDTKLISQPLPGFFNVITIVMVAITFLAIVVGMYGNIFDQFIRENTTDKQWYTCKLFNPGKYIDFFECQQKYSDNKYVDTIDILSEYPAKYNHLLLIDRTMSTIFIKEKDVTHFIDTLSKSLGTEFNIDNIQNAIKPLFITKLYQSLLHLDWGTFRNVFYDGYNSQNGNPIFLDTIPPETVIKGIGYNNSYKWIAKEECKEAIGRLLKTDFYTKKAFQKTSIKHIFQKINDLCNESKDLIVTVVSDFYDEDKRNISSSLIENLLQTIVNKPEQLNVIYLIPNDEAKKRTSDEIVRKLEYCLRGTSQNHIRISTKDFINNNFDEDIYKTFELTLMQAFSYVCSDITPIKFYHPRSNKDYYTAECRLFFKGSASDIHWRVITPFQSNSQNKEGAFIVHSNHDTLNYESAFGSNGIWHTIKISDTLHLKFPLTSRICNERFDLEIIQDNICRRYPVQFDEYVPYPVTILGKIMIVTIIVVLVLYSLLLWQWWLLKNMKNKLQTKWYNIIAIFVIFLISTLGIILCSYYIFLVLYVTGILSVLFLAFRTEILTKLTLLWEKIKDKKT